MQGKPRRIRGVLYDISRWANTCEEHAQTRGPALPAPEPAPSPCKHCSIPVPAVRSGGPGKGGWWRPRRICDECVAAPPSARQRKWTQPKLVAIHLPKNRKKNPGTCLKCGAPTKRAKSGYFLSNCSRSACKRKVTLRDLYLGHRCEEETCPVPGGYEPTNREELELDHIQPTSWGGTDDPSNLQTLCGICHNKKTVAQRGWARQQFERPA